MNKELADSLDSLVGCAQRLADSVRAVAEAAALTRKAEGGSPTETVERMEDTVEAPAAEATDTEVPFAEDGANKEAEARPAVTKEEVRALLAAKAAEDGGKHKATVKALVGKYANGRTLKQVPEEKYPELLKDLEAVT